MSLNDQLAELDALLSKCDWCGWTIKPTIEEGCTADSCSMRPLPQTRPDFAMRRATRSLRAQLEAYQAELPEEPEPFPAADMLDADFKPPMVVYKSDYDALRAHAQSLQAKIDAALAAPPSAEGWIAVPVEPTEEMMEAGYRAVGDSHYSPSAEKLQGWGSLAIHVYKAMLSAAPKDKP